jgi:multidrug efflux pump
MLVVFLCLAALYESWSIPFAVMLSVPIGIFGALLAATCSGQTNDVYFKVGLLTTIGLAAKNAILIVEFAIEQQAAGKGLVEATLEAARQRLRPILMTSLAFVLGVTPLAIASGAGSGSQNAIGIGVMGGMIAATVLGVFFVPLLSALPASVRKSRWRRLSFASVRRRIRAFFSSAIAARLTPALRWPENSQNSAAVMSSRECSASRITISGRVRPNSASMRLKDGSR